MLDIKSLTSLVDALRAETAKDSISPDSLGSILQKILDLLATAAASSDLDELESWRNTFNKPRSVVTDVSVSDTTAKTVIVDVNKASLGTNVASTTHFTLPMATTKEAGVMTVEQVATLNAAKEQAEKAVNDYIALSNTLNERFNECNAMFNQLDTAIAEEATAREDTDSTLKKFLSNEIDDRKEADTTLNTAINDEAAARKTADLALNTAISDEAAARESADTALNTAISDEAKSREAADTALNTAISTETGEREAADTTLQSNIDAEATAREAADTALKDSLNTEMSRRIYTDSDLKSSISNEVRERKDADAELQEKITEINKKIGKENGIAPLNAIGQLDNQYIPEYFDQIIKLVCVGTPESAPASTDDYYYDPDKKMLYRGVVYFDDNEGEGYKWETTPIDDSKIYIDRTTNIAYHLNNDALEPLESPAEGYKTSATGKYAHAEGSYTTASGQCTHAEGYSTTASGEDAHAEGKNTRATEIAAHAEGERTSATAYDSHAEGLNTTASGFYSHAEGDSTSATNTAAHAEGVGAVASGTCSHAEGNASTASGTYAHAEGNRTKATEYASHAEGGNTLASSQYAHAEGWYNTANAFCSHVEGMHNTVEGFAGHAEGCFNVASSDTIHCVGIGSGETDRKNAEEIIRDIASEKNGYKYIIGLGNYDGTNLKTANDSGKKIFNPDILSVQEIINDLITRVAALETAAKTS